MNGVVKYNFISDDGSVECGIEIFEDKYFGGDLFCFILFLLFYEEWY